MPINNRTREIIAVAQKSFKSGELTEFHALSLDELRMAHEDLGQNDINANFRIRMTNRIADLEKAEDRKLQKRWRLLDHAISFLAGVLVTMLANVALK